jgi:hypothetical protein
LWCGTVLSGKSAAELSVTIFGGGDDRSFIEQLEGGGGSSVLTMKASVSSETQVNFYQIALHIPGDNLNNILTVEAQFFVDLHCF